MQDTSNQPSENPAYPPTSPVYQPPSQAFQPPSQAVVASAATQDEFCEPSLVQQAPQADTTAAAKPTPEKVVKRAKVVREKTRFMTPRCQAKKPPQVSVSNGDLHV